MSSRLSKTLSLIALIALVAFGQMAFAQNTNRYRIQVVRRANQPTEMNSDALTKNLYALWQAMSATPSVEGASTNSDGTDIWPCFGLSTAAGGPTPDCPSIGDPSQVFPTGGVAVGVPAYLWSLSACNATSTSSPVCGETETFYEDDSGDTSGDLTYSLVATEGTATLLDTGTIDFTNGTGNPYGGLTPPGVVIIYGPTNLGDMGQAGKNNGNCLPNANYPLTAEGGTGEFIISADKICGVATAGAVTFTATTEVAKPAYTKETTAAKCGSTPPPCYTVKFTTPSYKASQKWTINLE
jgi:hypothetical protein